jgi:hypothetical protein
MGLGFCELPFTRESSMNDQHVAVGSTGVNVWRRSQPGGRILAVTIVLGALLRALV